MGPDAYLQIKASTLPPAQPTYVLRGHGAQIHAVSFLRHNTRLLTGDAEGWVVLWSVALKRAVAVWRAHQGSILGLQSWGVDRTMTHGRDNKINVWQLPVADEVCFSTVLPIDDTTSHRKQPWLLHCLIVNALNFCPFATCTTDPDATKGAPSSTEEADGTILIAVPGTQDAQIDIFSLPSEQIAFRIPALANTKTGMVMALRMLHHQGRLLVAAGYE
ncbi:Astra associated protein 1 Asa1, partial [Elasticomyces elasticus]